jgi:hypothetical protein
MATKEGKSYGGGGTSRYSGSGGGGGWGRGMSEFVQGFPAYTLDDAKNFLAPLVGEGDGKEDLVQANRYVGRQNTRGAIPTRSRIFRDSEGFEPYTIPEGEFPERARTQAQTASTERKYAGTKGKGVTVTPPIRIFNQFTPAGSTRYVPNLSATRGMYPLMTRAEKKALAENKMNPTTGISSVEFTQGAKDADADYLDTLARIPDKVMTQFAGLSDAKVTETLSTLGYNSNFQPKNAKYGVCAAAVKRFDSNDWKVLNPLDPSVLIEGAMAEHVVFYPMHVFRVEPATRGDSLRYQTLFVYYEGKHTDAKQGGNSAPIQGAKYGAVPINVKVHDARRTALAAARTAAHKNNARGRFMLAYILQQLLKDSRGVRELQYWQEAHRAWQQAKSYAKVCQKYQTDLFNEKIGTAKFYPKASDFANENWVAGTTARPPKATRLDVVPDKFMDLAQQRYAAGNYAPLSGAEFRASMNE